MRFWKEKNPRRSEGFFFGGDERDRTVDLLLAKQALYQLSYIPISGANSLAQPKSPVAQITVASKKTRELPIHSSGVFLSSRRRRSKRFRATNR
jgi:hypothetical protein